MIVSPFWHWSTSWLKKVGKPSKKPEAPRTLAVVGAMTIEFMRAGLLKYGAIVEQRIALHIA